MTFDEILPSLKQGKKARRLAWELNTVMTGSWLELVAFPPLPDGRFLAPVLMMWNIPLGCFAVWGGVNRDILADDWEIL